MYVCKVLLYCTVLEKKKKKMKEHELEDLIQGKLDEEIVIATARNRNLLKACGIEEENLSKVSKFLIAFL
jgi:hypothetical protein